MKLHREDIKAALRKRHGTMAAFEIARHLPTGSVIDVLRGRSVSKTAEAIATEIGIPVHKLFPSGKRESVKPDNKPGMTVAHRLNSGAR